LGSRTGYILPLRRSPTILSALSDSDLVCEELKRI
jgi:hypothetical protein